MRSHPQSLAYVIFLVAILSCDPGLCAQNPSPSTDSALESEFSVWHQNAKDASRAGELFKARSLYLQLMEKYPDSESIYQIRKEYWDVNIAIIQSPFRSRQTEIYTIHKGDTLGKIARKTGTTIELIKRRNQLVSNKIINGHKLSVWKGPFNIRIDKSDNVLILKTGEETIKIYPVSTGKDNSSPIGRFVIKDRYANPVWFHKGEIVPADDPKNFLGTRWLGFDLPKYGIHGTIEPERIGKQVSSGCIRMRNEDVQELYDLVPIGTTVTIED